MKYKEFVDWCNDRACDGYWSMMDAVAYIDIMHYIESFPINKREKQFQKLADEIQLVKFINETQRKYGLDEFKNTESNSNKITILDKIKALLKIHK